jgi:hypothetical protein
MFGNVKEYKVIEITKKIIQNKKWSLEEFDNKDIELVEDVLNNNGFVFALGKKIEKKKIVKGIYIFDKIKKDNDDVFIFNKTIFVEDIREEVICEFEDALDDYLGAVVSEQQVKKAYFRDKEFELKKVKVGKYEISAVVLWILWGVMMSICLDSFMWLCFGVCFATSSSYAIKVNGKSISVGESKRKKKKNKKNK